MEDESPEPVSSEAFTDDLGYISDELVEQMLAVSIHEADEVARARIAYGNLALEVLGERQLPGGGSGILRVRPEDMDGFCFLRAVARELGCRVGLDHRALAFYSLVHLARNMQKYAGFVDDEFAAQRADLAAQLPEYAGSLASQPRHARRNIHALLIDSFEGLLADDFTAERRYADALLVMALCDVFGLRAFVFKPGAPEQSLYCPARANGESSDHIQAVDLFVVHHAEAGSQHYDSVELSNETPWVITQEAQERVVAIIKELPSLAVLHASYTEARGWWASLLEHEENILDLLDAGAPFRWPCRAAEEKLPELQQIIRRSCHNVRDIQVPTIAFTLLVPSTAFSSNFE